MFGQRVCRTATTSGHLCVAFGTTRQIERHNSNLLTFSIAVRQTAKLHGRRGFRGQFGAARLRKTKNVKVNKQTLKRLANLLRGAVTPRAAVLSHQGDGPPPRVGGVWGGAAPPSLPKAGFPLIPADPHQCRRCERAVSRDPAARRCVFVAPGR